MSASLRVLLAGIIDYAGLFPPARLPMDQVVRNYACYRQEPECWMLGRFICPATRLEEVIPLEDELFQGGTPVRFSVLGRGGENPSAFSAGLMADREIIQSFQQRWQGRAVLDGYETRHGGDHFSPLCEAISHTMGGHAFCEPGPITDWRSGTSAILEAIRSVPESTLGFKLRCSGLAPSAFPSPEQVAFTITACRDAGVPLKFTAGLHHPVRHFDSSVQTKAHGFLNVFGAGVLAHARGLDTGQVEQIIADEDAGHFVFEEEGFRWKDLRATTAEIAAARERAVLSFGSCSFEEPRADLQALGLLE